MIHEDVKVANYEDNFLRRGYTKRLAALHHPSLHSSARLFFTPRDSLQTLPLLSSRDDRASNTFFFHCRLQSIRDDLLRSRRRPSSFFHPLNHPASTLSSRALNVCHPTFSPLLFDLLFPPALVHRRDSGIFFHPPPPLSLPLPPCLPFRDVSLLDPACSSSSFSSDELDLSQSRTGILA